MFYFTSVWVLLLYVCHLLTWMCLNATFLCMLSALVCVEQVPIVAVTTAGCGIRALTAMYGSILGLQKLRVLDCVSYISGSSGTTW